MKTKCHKPAFAIWTAVTHTSECARAAPLSTSELQRSPQHFWNLTFIPRLPCSCNWVHIPFFAHLHLFSFCFVCIFLVCFCFPPLWIWVNAQPVSYAVLKSPPPKVPTWPLDSISVTFSGHRETGVLVRMQREWRGKQATGAGGGGLLAHVEGQK